MHAAVANKLTEMAELLLDKGASVNARDVLGRSPLHLSCANGDVVCQLEIEYSIKRECEICI